MITNNLFTALEKNYYYELNLNNQLYGRARLLIVILFAEIGFLMNSLGEYNTYYQSNYFFLFFSTLTIIFLLFAIFFTFISFMGSIFKGYSILEINFSEVMDYSKKLKEFYNNKNKEKTSSILENYLMDTYLEVILSLRRVNAKRKDKLKLANIFLFFSTILFISILIYIFY